MGSAKKAKPANPSGVRVGWVPASNTAIPPAITSTSTVSDPSSTPIAVNYGGYVGSDDEDDAVGDGGDSQAQVGEESDVEMNEGLGLSHSVGRITSEVCVYIYYSVITYTL